MLTTNSPIINYSCHSKLSHPSNEEMLEQIKMIAENVNNSNLSE